MDLSKQKEWDVNRFTVYTSEADRDNQNNPIAQGGTGTRSTRGGHPEKFNIVFVNAPVELQQGTQYYVTYWEKQGSQFQSRKAEPYYDRHKGNNHIFSKVQSRSGEGSMHLSNFGMLGYGINAVENEPTTPIVEFTYENPSQSFTWNGEQIQVPDQIDFNETPRGITVDEQFNSKITTAREYQAKLKTKVGLSVEDPETDLTFSGSARYANELFSKNKGNWALEIYLRRADILFLELTKFDYADHLLEEVQEAIAACGTDPEKIAGFYDTYGTHVLKSAHIGGQLNIKTSVKIDSRTNTEISKGGIDIDAAVKIEDEDYINGKIKFDTRDQITNKVYREISTKQILLIGGDVSTKDEETWRKSLLNSKIPVRGSGKNIHGPGFASLQGSARDTNLGLVLLEYIEIYKVLGLDEEQNEAFEKGFNDYMDGLNPFDNTPQRLMPEMNRDYPISIAEIERTKAKGGVLPNRRTFEMRGWMATYVTSAGLQGKPGSWVDVSCKSDAEPGGWTRKRIYAGEVLNLRDKTPYLSKYMHIQVDAYGGDNEAVVYTNNELTSW